MVENCVACSRPVDGHDTWSSQSESCTVGGGVKRASAGQSERVAAAGADQSLLCRRREESVPRCFLFVCWYGLRM